MVIIRVWNRVISRILEKDTFRLLKWLFNEKIVFEAQIIKEYICHKNNITQLYFILG